MLVIRTNDLDRNSVGRDSALVAIRLIQHYNKPMFWSKIMKQLCLLFPDVVFTGNQGYPPTLMYVKDTIKRMQDEGIVTMYKPEGKRYNLLKIVNKKKLDAMAKKKFKTIPTTDAEIKQWCQDVMEELGDGGPANFEPGPFESKESAIDSLF